MRRGRRGRASFSAPIHEEPIKTSAVINISDLPLSDDCISVLSRGLSFSPTYSGKDFDTKVDLFRFYRSLHLKVWYHQNTYNTVARSASTNYNSPFRPKSTFLPPNTNSTLTTFTKKVSYEVEKLFDKQKKIRRYNLTKKRICSTQMAIRQR